MATVTSSVVWILFYFVFILVRGDTEVFCQFSQSCMLPCKFSTGDDVVIHWIQLKSSYQVHSFYYNKDQLELQNEPFKDRTSLFNDQISRGNASLQLRGVKVQDEGKYQCYTSTISGIKELFIKLNVYAPVQAIKIEKIKNTITCRSDGIYPNPDLSWEPSSASPQPNKTKTKEELYDISSSMTLPDAEIDLKYSCTVNTSRSRKKVTLFKQDYVNSTDSEKTIPCQASDIKPKSLIWRFNKSQLILTRHKPEDPYEVSEEWKKYVKDVSVSGSLTLQGLSQDQEGIYTCESSDTEETFLKHTVLHQTGSSDHQAKTAVIAGVVLGIILLAIAVGFVFFLRKRKKDRRTAAEKICCWKQQIL